MVVVTGLELATGGFLAIGYLFRIGGWTSSPLFKFTGKSRLQTLANSRTIARDRVPRRMTRMTGEDWGLVVRPKGSLFSGGTWIYPKVVLPRDDILGSSLPGRIDSLRMFLSALAVHLL
ncbi:hypothetical protein MLD38_005257 [Melastoma candidum]|uniref:Uncharacterized protein n=1 Tax=Melastoma candidum TaxID=119954 RepID=A0ACB9S7G5_9MYRT|nr:hypothetical protein MLD38_005257 [Melastoma candidum]